MKNKDMTRSRLSLTLLFSVAIFIILFIAIALTIGIIYLLVFLEALPTYDGEATEVTPVLWLMSLISLIIGFGMSTLLLRFPLKPFNRIISQMNALASGDFKARMHFGKNMNAVPAFAEVINSFNRMAEELDKTEMFRQDFINNFSHEFKTPIVSIAGFAKLLKRGNLTEEQQNEYISIIEEESMRLSDMATNVLNLTKIENQSILSNVKTFNISEQIRHCVLLLENKWEKKNIDFDLDFSEHNISACEEMLKQVWINLIDNAIKFSPTNSTVSVSIEEKKDSLTINVTNKGSYIPEEEKQNIFRKFYQSDRSHASYGNGIGLAIVKKVIDLHEGKIVVKSENETTSFIVILKKS